MITADPPTAVEVPPGDDPSPRSRRHLLPLVLIPVGAAVIVAVWWFGFHRSSGTSEPTVPTATKQVVTVTSGTMSRTVSAQGTIAAADTDELSFAAAGTVTAVHVKAGDTVQAGQVLATLDSTELQAAVTKAESTATAAQTKVTNDVNSGASSAQTNSDYLDLQSALSSLQDARDALAGADLVATIDGTVSNVDLTVGEVLGSGGSGSVTPTGSASGSGASSTNLGSSSSSARVPTGSSSGSSTGATTGSSSSQGQITVVSTGRYEVSVKVASADVAQVAVGQRATLTTTSSTSSSSGGFPGLPGGAFPSGGFSGGAGQQDATGGANRTVTTGGRGNGAAATGGTAATSSSGATATGTVTEVGKVADASSGVATYPVTIAFDGDPATFFVGGSVTAAITVEQVTDAVQVPVQAVTTTNAGSTVQVSTDGSTDATTTRTVITGLTSNGMVQITSGLTTGEQVVVSRGGPGGFTPPSGATGRNGSGTGTGSGAPAADTGSNGR